jgi:hypothetical protein
MRALSPSTMLCTVDVGSTSCTILVIGFQSSSYAAWQPWLPLMETRLLRLVRRAGRSERRTSPRPEARTLLDPANGPGRRLRLDAVLRERGYGNGKAKLQL